ncbi:MAG: DUF1467 family protein [Robiginitomaculum sp.]
MTIVTGIAIYFVLWWVCLFTVLPWGIKGQHEEGNVVKGSEPGAPIAPRLKHKVIQTSVVAAIVWFIIFVVVKYHLITLDDIPFLPNFVPEGYR